MFKSVPAQGIGAVIRKRRQELKLKQSHVAEVVGTSPEFIAMVENGTRQFNLDRLPRVADVLSLDCKSLIRVAMQRECPSVCAVLFGEEPISPESIPQQETDRILITPEMADVAARIDSLPRPARQTILGLVDQLSSANRQIHPYPGRARAVSNDSDSVEVAVAQLGPKKSSESASEEL